FYYPDRKILVVSAGFGSYFNGTREFEAQSHDDAVRYSRREIPRYYQELPGHSLVGDANVELATCIIIPEEVRSEPMDNLFIPDEMPSIEEPQSSSYIRRTKPKQITLDDLGHTHEHLTSREVAMLLGVTASAVTKVARARPNITTRHGHAHLFHRNFIRRVLDTCAERPYVQVLHALRHVD
ncbi:MAG: hypothetical protein ACYDAR_11835, partial [Thermomicrobiales bacterium]